MATYTHTQRGHHLQGDRIILILLAVVAVLAVAAGATLVWDWASTGTDSGDTVEAVGPTTETLDHAARMAESGRRLNALRAVAVSNPPLAETLAEDIATLELVVTGQLPVEVTERAPVEASQPDTRTGPDLRIEVEG